MRTKEQQDAYNKARRERCAALGICVSCNKPSNGLRRCLTCSDKRRDYHSAYNKGYSAGKKVQKSVPVETWKVHAVLGNLFEDIYVMATCADDAVAKARMATTLKSSFTSFVI